jgi:hypothetical protein
MKMNKTYYMDKDPDTNLCLYSRLNPIFYGSHKRSFEHQTYTPRDKINSFIKQRKHLYIQNIPELNTWIIDS